jgi:DNA (cytosine-5)-methyltransferase 1
MISFGVLFGGFDSVSIGAMAAGATPLWAIEREADIAAVAQGNLDHKIIVSDILDIDPHTMTPVDVLHASPPCPSFSIAKQNNEETEADIVLAQKVADFTIILQPRIFTLENVWMYRHSQSWGIIRETLYGLGYWMDVTHSNSADFGVPQTRKRMIVRAIKGAMVPYMPQPEAWQGWYAAIEDLIPSLPDSQFAPWQIDRLPEELKTILMAVGGEGSNYFEPGEPAQTITAAHGANKYRAFIVGDQYQTSNNGTPRTVQNKGRDCPVWTITASEHGDTRAFILGQGTRSTPLLADNPSQTITANSNQTGVKAAVSPHRIVSMTPRALARFQSFPDWYKLPASRTLACRGIGNAMPSVWYEKILKGLL